MTISAGAASQMIALLQMDGRPVLLTAKKATAAAYMTALRVHFQRAKAQELSEPNVTGIFGPAALVASD